MNSRKLIEKIFSGRKHRRELAQASSEERRILKRIGFSPEERIMLISSAYSLSTGINELVAFQEKISELEIEREEIPEKDTHEFLEYAKYTLGIVLNPNRSLLDMITGDYKIPHSTFEDYQTNQITHLFEL